MTKQSKAKNQELSSSRSANAGSSGGRPSGYAKTTGQLMSKTPVGRQIESISVPLTDEQVMDQFLAQAPDMNESRHRSLEEVVQQLSDPLSSRNSRKTSEKCAAQHVKVNKTPGC